MIIDIYTHILPAAYSKAMSNAAPALADIGKRMKSLTLLHDLDAKFREMDQFGDYRQIISLPNPPIEDIADARAGAELARIGNDSMAALVATHPDRFPGFVAALSMHDMDSAMKELHRAVGTLGAVGVQVFTNVAGTPIDDMKYRPVFETMAEYDLPIWMHPTRTASATDYATEDRSRYELWWLFGWPYDTSVAMTRLVLTGLFEKLPGLKLITHHLGAMIPYFDGRIELFEQTLGSRTTDEDYAPIMAKRTRPLLDDFRMFYGDTAMIGSTTGVKCGLEFFGADHVAFSTDAPFGPIGKTIASMDYLGLSDVNLRKVLVGNAEKLMNRKFES